MRKNDAVIEKQLLDELRGFGISHGYHPFDFSNFDLMVIGNLAFADILRCHADATVFLSGLNWKYDAL